MCRLELHLAVKPSNWVKLGAYVELVLYVQFKAGLCGEVIKFGKTRHLVRIDSIYPV